MTMPIHANSSFENLKDLVDYCVAFYKNNFYKLNDNEILKRRRDLSRFVEKFHKDCGTLTPSVQEKIDIIKGGDACVLLMTAHQPNLFAYSGVLRKAALNFVLAKQLEKRLGVNIVNFFGLADQDFTDDRWVKSAHLPAVNRRDGVLTLNISLPKGLMLNKIPKPSPDLVNKWKNEIKGWLCNAINSVGKFCKSEGISEWSSIESFLNKNFEDFWKIVEDAYDQSKSYSDFNAFLMSKIINEVWGYDTLFSRFSECQQIFSQEFAFLLSHFIDYSQFLSEVNDLLTKKGYGGGVSDQEPELAPFWYHCNCGSKVRLFFLNQLESFMGYGECLNCKKEYRLSFGSLDNPDVSGVASRLSARAIPMTLIFFKGLGVSCYVGGVGGLEYLVEAQYVARKMDLPFPPVAFWRPHDTYLGISQLEAVLEFKRITGSFKISDWMVEADRLKSRIDGIRKKMDELEVQKKKLIEELREGREDKIELKEKIKTISINQSRIKGDSNLSVLNLNLKTLENIPTVFNMIPCIIDYAINVGLCETSEQWIKHLSDSGNFSSNVLLKSVLDNLIQFKDVFLSVELPYFSLH